jgi:hypothetical protein
MLLICTLAVLMFWLAFIRFVDPDGYFTARKAGSRRFPARYY